MGRTNTAIWEEIKSEHTICLCYSESKGLYVSSIYFAPEEEILFLPHGYKGFWEREVQIPKDNLSIKKQQPLQEQNKLRIRQYDLYEGHC